MLFYIKFFKVKKISSQKWILLNNGSKNFYKINRNDEIIRNLVFDHKIKNYDKNNFLLFISFSKKFFAKIYNRNLLKTYRKFWRKIRKKFFCQKKFFFIAIFNFMIKHHITYNLITYINFIKIYRAINE